MTFIKNLIIFFFVLYLLIGLLLYLKQRSLLYAPSPLLDTSFQTTIFNNNGVKIKTFIANPNKEEAVLYFGGNAEAVAYSVQAFEKTLPNHTLYFVNYRGYGGSSGQPTEEGLYSDALFIYDSLKKLHTNIHIIGRSLGSGVATYLASQRKIEQLVLVTPFDSIRSVAQELFPFYPMSILLKDHFDSLSRAKELKVQNILMITGAKDSIVSRTHSQKLYNAFKPSIVKHLDFDKEHNDIQIDLRYYPEIKKFIEDKKIKNIIKK